MSGHLGEQAGAFADGALSAEKMARAWSHYRSCIICRDLVAGQREVREELRKLRHSKIPPDILNGLYAIASEEALQPRRRHRAPVGATKRPRRRSAVRMLTGVGAAACAIVSGLWVLGGGQESGMGLLEETLAAARAHRDVAVEQPASRVTDVLGADWAGLDSLPTGYSIEAIETKEGAASDHVHIYLSTPTGKVSLTVSHTLLRSDHVGVLEPQSIGGRTVHGEESGGRITGLWQSGEDAVAFVSEASVTSLETIIKGTPETQSSSFPTRVSRGWHFITSALD